jgi:hypothetical protein
MAFLNYGNTAVDMHNLNFNALFAGVTSVTTLPSDPIHTTPLDITVGDTVFHLPSHDLAIDTFVRIDGSGLTTAMQGTGFTFDGLGAVTGGAITYLICPGVGFSGIELSGMKLSVADYLAVTGTALGEDDFRLMRHVLGGNDMVFASDKDDVLICSATLAAAT